MPPYPTMFQLLVDFDLSAKLSIALTGLLLPFFPIKTSAINTGNPRVITKNIYKRTNSPPPFSPALYGKPQIFPSPTAEPVAASKNAVLLFH